MTPESSPLLEAFFKLRERRFPLGVQEYLTALRALSLGYGIGSRARLIFLCKTLWAKSPDEQRQIEDVFKAVLPPTLTEQELETYLAVIEKEVRPMNKADRTAPASGPTPQAQEPDQTRQAPQQQQPGLPGRLAAAEPRGRLNLTPQASPSEPMEIDLPAPPVRDWQYNPNLDFVGQLPIAKRQMKNSWRYLRRMQRLGQRTELDVPGTIERTYQNGILLEPVLMPRRTNQARLLILVDEGGSMLPFRRTTNALLESAEHSGLRQVAVYYFHDAPLLYLFNHPLMRQKHAERIQTLLEQFSGASVLILSDGGAARGNLDESRAKQTAEFLQKLRERRFDPAWLNPTPAERWSGTTAEILCKKYFVKMMSYNRAGLDAAVNVLRGMGC